MPLGYRVIREIERPNPATVATLGSFFSADLADSMNKAGAMRRTILPLYAPMPRFAGPAVTASLPSGSFTMGRIAMEQCKEGDVLVLNAYGDVSHAMLGGHLGHALKARGVAGIIVDGAVRDVSELQELGLPVFATGTAMVVGGHLGPGEINVPVACGGVVVNPGDVIVADSDGVVSVPRLEVNNVINRMAALKKSHGANEDAYERGEFPGIEQMIRDTESAGCEYI